MNLIKAFVATPTTFTLRVITTTILTATTPIIGRILFITKSYQGINKQTSSHLISISHTAAAAPPAAPRCASARQGEGGEQHIP